MTTPVRRDNGLVADDYVRVARPRPAVAEAALDALRRTGIAAFATDVEDGPDAAHGTHGALVTDDPDAHAGERLELWTDARELDDVTTVLAAVVRHAGHDARDLGLVGEELVLGDLDVRPAPDDLLGTRNPTPSARPYPTPSRPHLRPRDDRDPLDRPVPPVGSGSTGRPDQVSRDVSRDVPGDIPPTGPRDLSDLDDLPDDPDDHFRPDEPESLRTLSRTTGWALAILALGVVALAVSGLAPSLIGAYATLVSLLGTAAMLVGVGMLITRLRSGHPDDGDGGDDGAVL